MLTTPLPPSLFLFFFFNDTATTEIYTLSLHDALPISQEPGEQEFVDRGRERRGGGVDRCGVAAQRSEEHTSELQSRLHLVCRLLLEKKKKKKKRHCMLRLKNTKVSEDRMYSNSQKSRV